MDARLRLADTGVSLARIGFLETAALNLGRRVEVEIARPSSGLRAWAVRAVFGCACVLLYDCRLFLMGQVPSRLALHACV
jgi:hypothetical protein